MDTSESVLDEDGLLRASPSSIYLYSGGQINPLDPDPEAILLIDIAHNLSNQCRWTGATNRFYSVAEHCVLVSRLLWEMGRTKEAFAGLLHDASEAYIQDMSRPLKRSAKLGAAYLEVEEVLEAAIGVAFNIGAVALEIPIVKWADDQLLKAEAHALLPGLAPHMPEPETPITIYGWEPTRAKEEFLLQFERTMLRG